MGDNELAGLNMISSIVRIPQLFTTFKYRDSKTKQTMDMPHANILQVCN